MILELLAQMIGEPCQNILRTQEQLGYIVFSGIRKSSGVQGLRVIVQSDRHPAFVDERVETFLNTMAEYIETMPDEEFERHKEALAVHRLEKPKKLGGLTSRFWLEISSQQYNFDRANIEVTFMKTLTKRDVMKFFNEYVHNQGARRHKLAVHVLSMAEGGAGLNLDSLGDEKFIEKQPCAIEDITKFKSSQGLFPLAQPYISINLMNTKSKL